jgi:hypothetical protein
MPITKRSSSVALILLTAALAACADRPEDVTAPRGAPQFAAQSSDGPSSLDLIESDLVNGLLDKNNGNKYRSYAVLAPEKLPAKYRTNTIGKDATYSMVQLAKDWDELSASTKSEIMDLQASGFGELKNIVETEHFVLHFATQGNSAVPALDANGNGTPDFIDVAAESWEVVWDRQLNQLGYPAPKGTPAQKFHVYYKQLAYYGYCAPTNVERRRPSRRARRPPTSLSKTTFTASRATTKTVPARK